MATSQRRELTFATFLMLTETTHIQEGSYMSVMSNLLLPKTNVFTFYNDLYQTISEAQTPAQQDRHHLKWLALLICCM